MKKRDQRDLSYDHESLLVGQAAACVSILSFLYYLRINAILMYGDAYNPPAGEEIRTPERGPEYAAQLVQKINELNLKPERIAPVHGRVVPYRNLLTAFNLEGASRGTK